MTDITEEANIINKCSQEDVNTLKDYSPHIFTASINL